MVNLAASWPDWWSWELDCGNPHLAKRMIDRSFSETDLCDMLQRATGYHQDHEPGRWAIETSHENKSREVIVEPDRPAKLLIVVTAYPVRWFMSIPFLEVTYRQGKPFAAYLYLNRQPAEKAADTRREGDLIVDYNAAGRPIGIEFSRVTLVDLSAVNRVLIAAHEVALTVNDLAPLLAA